jgi:hypothetical protein
VWFTTVCALSVALAALSYNLFAVLGQISALQEWQGWQLGGCGSGALGRHVLHGVDVTGSGFFSNPRVLAAVEFAAAAHAGQVGRGGDWLGRVEVAVQGRQGEAHELRASAIIA